MGYFDFLIDKDNALNPNPNMEYIYLMDIIWNPNKLEEKTIKYGTIMKNVKRLENGSYEFQSKETNEIFCTNYSWSLAENTTENIERIKEYNKKNKKLQRYKKYVDTLRKNIKTLESNG